MYLAITGAAGFVGRGVVREARRRGYEVVGLSRSPEGARRIEEAGGVARVAALEPDVLREAFAGCGAVVHLAHIGAERGGETYEAVNVRGTETVARAATEAGVGRVVMFSGLGVAHYGMTPRCTNAYFRSKLAAEAMLFRQSAEPVVFRPSYVVGPGDGLTRALARAMAAGEVEQVGDGGYRLQPIAIADAAAAVLAAAAAPAPGPRPSHRTAVFDLVGPEPVAYAVLVGRLAAALAAAGRPARFRVRTIPVESADAAAARGGYQGMAPDELDCLLCDELADPTPLAGLLGRSLTPLDEALSEAVAGPA